jgi:hypothetical protein
MFNFYKPDWLYQPLPFVYIVAGITTISYLGNTLSMMSGGLLISAGVYIWRMRRIFRDIQRSKRVGGKVAARGAFIRAEMDRISTQQMELERSKAERRER